MVPGTKSELNTVRKVVNEFLTSESKSVPSRGHGERQHSGKKVLNRLCDFG